MSYSRLALVFALVSGPCVDAAFAGINCREDAADSLPFVIRVADTKKDEHCTGAVFKGRYVLTAGHCLYLGGKQDSRLTETSNLHVFLGPHGDQQGPRVKRFQTHPKYHGTFDEGQYDLAVLELETALPGRDLDFRDISLNQRITVAGYGVTTNGGWKSDNKRRTGEGVIGRTDRDFVCLREVTLPPPGEPITERIGCIPAGQDSGSPLIWNGAIRGALSKIIQTWHQDSSTTAESCYINLQNPEIRSFLEQF